MIEKLNNTEGVAKSQTTAGQRELLREYRNRFNELIDAVNALEAAVYGCDDDGGYDGCCHCNCDCHDLPDDDDDTVTSEVQKVVDQVRRNNQLREVNTTDGLFSEFTAYVAANPGQRFGQAVTNFTGFRKVWGEDKNDDLHDLWEWKGKV